MNESPYTPPRIPPETPTRDQPPQASWFRRITFDIAGALLGTFLPHIALAWAIGLICVWNFASPRTFHLTFATLVLAPAIGAFLFAFVRRPPANPDSSPKIYHWTATIGGCFIGTLLLSLYLYAVCSKWQVP